MNVAANVIFNMWKAERKDGQKVGDLTKKGNKNGNSL
tara:strand:+ start:111 stop:221 length:111 start_codon:yes stop_codon:yes gene_type:complete